MASDAAVLNIESENQKEAEANLQFQDFGTNSRIPTDNGTGISLDSQESDEESNDEAQLLHGGQEKKPAPSLSPWSFAYYQSYFDVDTNQVLERIMWSAVPLPTSNYLEKRIRPNPDLYGPFWVCVTLIFSTAISGNLANYLQMANQGTCVWKYDFNKVSLAATAVYTYSTIIPLILWLLLWYRRSETGYTLLEILCVYGYSLSVYIPISILWVIPSAIFQWILVILGSFMSGFVLVFTMWPAVKNDARKISLPTMVIVLLCHFLLATGFVLYFFNIPDSCTTYSNPTAPSLTTILPTTVASKTMATKAI